MLSIIVAIDSKRGIGKNNGLMWHISEELKRFRQITTGHPIIMGRKTFVSIGRVLPGRTNIIITRDSNYAMEGTTIVHSLDEALAEAKKSPGAEEICVIGGGQIYQQALSLADRLYITVVEGDFGADTFFPDYSDFKKIVSQEQKEEGEYRYKLLVLER